MIRNRRSCLWLAPAMLVCWHAATQVSAQLPKTAATSEEGYLSNSVIDVIEHDGYVWLATSKGANASDDGGLTWQIIDVSSGLVSDNVSAMSSAGQRVWLGTNHSEEIDGVLYMLGDGVSFSDDNGESWTQVDFSSSGQNISWIWGGDRIVYDITAHDDWVFFTAFAGGFLMSGDGGENFQRTFPTPTDSIQYYSGSEPSYRNRYFSCRIDTSRVDDDPSTTHNDSTVVWAGSAGGVFEYIYAPPRGKPYSPYISTIVFCDSCEDTSYVFLGGNRGLTRGTTVGEPFVSRFEEDGLSGPFISAMIDFRGRLLAGTVDAVTREAVGLLYSDDRGESFQSVSSFEQLGTEADTVTGFASMDERLYVAAQDAGLLVSIDTGLNWERILIDSVETASLKNVVNAVHVWENTLLVGTDTGLAFLDLDAAGSIETAGFHSFPEYDSTTIPTASSTRVMKVKAQPFYDSTGVLDSLRYWTINRPLTDDGRAVIAWRNPDAPSEVTWITGQMGVVTNDIEFIGNYVFVVGEAGIRYTTNGVNPSHAYKVEQKDGDVVVDSLGNDNITDMAVRGDTIWFGCDNGFAYSTNRGGEYRIVRINSDPLARDTAVNYTASSTERGLIGDFIPALGVQHLDDGPANIWASCRDVSYLDTNSISVGRIVPVDAEGVEVDPSETHLIVGWERHWQSLYRDGFAWNFAFNGDSVFAATDGGLLFRTDDTGHVWDTLLLQDSDGQALVRPGTPVIGVGIVDDYLWAGTDDGTVRISLDDLGDQQINYVIDSTTPADQVYAYPVPFSHSSGAWEAVDFHFVVERDAYITLEIYDFAMNLVSRVIDNHFYPAGFYPASGVNRFTWDGHNDKGEEVAVGVYYFKVEYSTGEVHWGKLAVVP